MCCSKQSTEQHADTSNDNIGNSKERVAATHDGTSTDQDGFGAIVDSHGEICGKRLSIGTR